MFWLQWSYDRMGRPRHVYRRDAAGEQVRIRALQIVADTGCTCQTCKHTWLPRHYLLLRRVLGFDTPEGVVG